MPSQITRLLTGYKKALDDSEARYESLHISRSKNAKVFYNKLIKDYSTKFADSAENQFVSTDDEKLDLSFIHNQLMQLAEVYLALDLVSASTLRPKIILWDHSMSSVLASTTVWVDDIDLVGYSHRGTKLTIQDIIIGYPDPLHKADWGCKEPIGKSKTDN